LIILNINNLFAVKAFSVEIYVFHHRIKVIIVETTLSLWFIATTFSWQPCYCNHFLWACYYGVYLLHSSKHRVCI